MNVILDEGFGIKSVEKVEKCGARFKGLAGNPIFVFFETLNIEEKLCSIVLNAIIILNNSFYGIKQILFRVFTNHGKGY